MLQFAYELRKAKHRGVDMIKYAVIGRGKIAEQYIEGANLSGRFELAAIYSRTKETGMEFAKKYSVTKVYTQLQEMIEDKEIEAVYIASPNSCHEWQSEILLKGGKHVICEKPIATSANGYQRLKQLADSLGLIYMEAIIPVHGKSRKRIKDSMKTIGNIALARIDYCQLSSRYERFVRGEQVNIFDMSLAAGTLMDLGVYCVYAAVDLFGMPLNIKASASYLKNGADGSGSAIFEYDTFSVMLTYSKVGESVAPSEIVGDKGSIVIERIGLYTGAHLVQNNERISLYDEEVKEKLMSYEATAFAKFIDGEELEEYDANSQLCLAVHSCMDEIKRVAGIQYS